MGFWQGGLEAAAALGLAIGAFARLSAPKVPEESSLEESPETLRATLVLTPGNQPSRRLTDCRAARQCSINRLFSGEPL
jgi:hypothetical protein